MILPIYFLTKNISPEIITLTIGVAATPMIIKFIWGGVVDYFARFGRKRFIVIGGILSVISLLVQAFIDPGIALLPFAGFVTLCWIGVGFLDVSADAWAIQISKEIERGKINGAMYSGQNLGMAVGAVALPFLADIINYQSIFLGSALIVLIIILFPLIIEEQIIITKQQHIGRLLLDEIKKKKIIILTIFAIIFGSSAGMLLFIAPLFMDIALTLDLTQIGLITMVFTIASAIGAIIGGSAADRWGRAKTIGLLMLASILFSAALVFAYDWQNFLTVYAVIGFLQGGYFAAALALFMDNTNPKVGATQFSIFMGLGNFGEIGISAISGAIYAMSSFNHVFLYAAWFFGPTLIILYIFNLNYPQVHK